MPTIRSLCGILPLPSLLVRARAPKQLFGLKEDTGTGPRSPSGFTSGTHGLSSSDGRLLLNRPFAHSPRSPRHKGQGEGLFKRGGQGLQNALDVREDIVVPDAKYAVAEGCEVSIANFIGRAIGMLPTIDLDNQTLLSTDEIDVIAPDRLLAGKLEPAEPTVAQLQPKHPLRARAAAARRTRAECRFLMRSAHCASSVSALCDPPPPPPGPLPACGERESWRGGATMASISAGPQKNRPPVVPHGRAAVLARWAGFRSPCRPCRPCRRLAAFRAHPWARASRRPSPRW